MPPGPSSPAAPSRPTPPAPPEAASAWARRYHRRGTRSLRMQPASQVPQPRFRARPIGPGQMPASGPRELQGPIRPTGWRWSPTSRWRRRAATTSSRVRLLPSWRVKATVMRSCRRVDCGLGALAGTERHTWTTGVARRLRKLGDSEQDGRVLDGMQRVPRLGNDQEVAVASFPLGGVSNEPHPSSQHLEGRLAGIFVF
jgi:hypothetical protein